MKNKNMKIISILVIVVVLGLVFFLGRSYAYFETSIAGGNVTMGVGKLIHSLNSNVVLKSGEKKEIDLVVKSNDDVASKYQVYYTSSSDLTNVLVGYANDSVDLPSGDIEANGSKNITIVFENNSANDVSIEVGVRGGLSKNTVEDIVLKDGENRVVTEMEPAVGDDFAAKTAATATSDLITEGYTAWVNGELVTGTRPPIAKTQSGSKSQNIANGAGVTWHFTFNEQFDVVPTVTWSANFTLSGGKVYNVTRTGFDFTGTLSSGSWSTSEYVTFYWTATVG